MIWVRRSSPYFSTISASSSETICRCRASLARMSSRSAIVALELGQPVDDLLALERGQPAQLHVEDRVGLELVDLEQLHQAAAGLVDVGRAPDQRDHLVERVERLDQAALDVGALARPRAGGSGSAAG